jgi:hypothetical protein
MTWSRGLPCLVLTLPCSMLCMTMASCAHHNFFCLLLHVRYRWWRPCSVCTNSLKNALMLTKLSHFSTSCYVAPSGAVKILAGVHHFRRIKVTCSSGVISFHFQIVNISCHPLSPNKGVLGLYNNVAGFRAPSLNRNETIRRDVQTWFRSVSVLSKRKIKLISLGLQPVGNNVQVKGHGECSSHTAVVSPSASDSSVRQPRSGSAQGLYWGSWPKANGYVHSMDFLCWFASLAIWESSSR